MHIGELKYIPTTFPKTALSDMKNIIAKPQIPYIDNHVVQSVSNSQLKKFLLICTMANIAHIVIGWF